VCREIRYRAGDETMNLPEDVPCACVADLLAALEEILSMAQHRTDCPAATSARVCQCDAGTRITSRARAAIRSAKAGDETMNLKGGR